MENKNLALTTGVGISVGVLASVFYNYLQRKNVEHEEQQQRQPLNTEPSLNEDEEQKRRKFI